MPKQGKLFIGVPLETSFQEKRCALTPTSVRLLANNGHRVVIQSKAGEGANFKDIEYSEAGAEVVHSIDSVFEAHIILKVAPLTPVEIDLLKPEQLIFSPLHLPTVNTEHLERMMEKRVTAFAYEYLKDNAGSFPVVRILSEIAGTASIQIAAQFLSNINGGKGILLGGISSVPPAKITILGAGVVGEYAARAAIGFGAEIRVFDNALYKLMRLQNNIGNRIYTSVINPDTLLRELKTTDVVIGAIHSETGSSPCVVSEDMIQEMQEGSLVIDVSVDQGGCFETSEITTHKNPVFQKHGVFHYCVPNIASRVSRTATRACSNVITTMLLEALKHRDFDDYLYSNLGTRNGAYLYKGKLTNQFLGKRFNIKTTNLDLLLSSRF
ncbi:UNVERIFIED_CONTAM: hypothetical protein GTU68_061701 [Idotea baltica]|nr:hypothetical protein [Idotea baltica]